MPTVSPAYTSWLGADTSPVDKDDARTYLAALEATISPMREVLTANRTYYVRTDGSDSNTGLANTAGGAFLTLQAAINAAASIDISIYTVTISVAAGTYSSGVITLKACVGAGEVVITGDTTTPGNVIISSSGNAFSGTGIRTVYTIRGFALRTSNSSAYCFDLSDGTYLKMGKLKFGGGSATFRAHFRLQRSAYVVDISGMTGYEIAESPGWYHIYAVNGGFFSLVNTTTVTITGTPAWGFGFVKSDQMSSVLIGSTTVFSGSATGVRYSATLNSVINVQGAGASFLPGGTAGSTATGGQYA